MKAFYVSVWDDDIEIKTICDFDPETKEITNIEQCEDVESLDILLKEYIESFEGKVLLQLH